jgi:tetratricopeptide (TPR) repeat protein
MGKATPRLEVKRPGGPLTRPGAIPSTPVDPHRIPTSVLILFLLHMAVLFSIEIAMTPLTNNLDDIKQTLFHLFAPCLMTLGLVGIALKTIPLPTRWVGRGLVAYWLIMVVSTLASHFRWMGWDQVIMIWAAGGLFLSALAAGAHERTNVWFVRYLVVQWLVVNLIGYMMFDFWSVGDHLSVVGWLFRHLYGENPSSFDNFYALLLTLNNADTQLQSSILNRDFYAGLSLLYLPFCLLLTLEPGGSRHLRLWRSLGAVTAFLTTLSVFLCQSKGEYIFWVVMMFYFIVMFLRYGFMKGLARRHLLAGMLACAMIMGVVVWMKSPTLMNNLKSVGLSFSSRSIMWKGAWKMFLDYPFWGGGPGSYRVYFSNYRAPDYFLHEIANVTTFSHNYFLDLLSESGIFGLTAFLIFLTSLWFGGLRWAVRHPDGRTRMVMITVTAALIGMFGSNLSSPNARWIIGASNLWTVLGFLAGSLRLAGGWRPQLAGAPTPAATGGFPASPVARYAVLGVLVLSLPMWVIAGKAGVDYWGSARLYANGLQYMEGGMQMLGQQEMERTKQMLVASADLFEQSLTQDPHNVSAYYKVGSVYSTLDRIFEDSANAVRGSKPQEAQILQTAADNYCQLALERYQKLDELMPDYAEIHYNFGIVYDRMANVLRRQSKSAASGQAKQMLALADSYDEKSREHLERMHKLSVKAEVYQMLGNQYQAKGELADALRIYQEAVQRYPDNLELVRKYHDAALLSNQTGDMFEALRLLWHSDPQNDDFVQRMLNTCVENKLAPQLAKLADELIEKNPLDPRAYYARMILAGWSHNENALLVEADHYRKAGGRQTAVFQMAIKAAASLGKTDQAAEFQQYLQKISPQPTTGSVKAIQSESTQPSKVRK